MRKVYEKQYLAILTIPLVALNQTQTGVECSSCHIRFSLSSIRRHSATRTGRGQTPMVFAGTALRSALVYIGPDSDPNDELIGYLVTSFERHSDGDTIDREDIANMRSTLEYPDSLEEYLGPVRDVLSPDQVDTLAQYLEQVERLLGQ